MTPIVWFVVSYVAMVALAGMVLTSLLSRPVRPCSDGRVGRPSCVVTVSLNASRTSSIASVCLSIAADSSEIASFSAE
jgi:hypothetical protein